MSIASKILQSWRRDGVRGVRRAFSNYRRGKKRERDYQTWVAKQAVTDESRNEMRRRIAEFESRPSISLILPVYNVDERWLRRCIESVLDQIYEDWELCIADDASTAPHVRPVLEEFARRDDRVRVVFREENGHISAASNSALEMASGEWVVLLDHDDELAEDALYWVVNEVNEHPDVSVIYSDEDLIDVTGRRHTPKFKPDFSRDLFYSFNLLTHISAFRTDLIRLIGGFRMGFEGSQDYDLSLRAIEKIDESQIRHIPRILYHWRAVEGSVAFSMEEKPYAHERARQSIREHFQRTGVDAEVFATDGYSHQVQYAVSGNPTVSYVVSVPDETNDMKADETIRIVRGMRNGGSVEELNRAARESDADVLVFVDSDLFREGIGDELAPFALRPRIGAVGAKVIDASGLVEQCGIVLGADLMPAFAHSGFARHAGGDMSRNRVIGNFSAVGLSCFAIRRELFDRVGGFDATVPHSLADVDLCLRLRKVGLRIVTVPHVEVSRSGAKRAALPKVSKGELEQFRNRWPEYVERDPFCNPNLKRDGSFEIKV